MLAARSCGCNAAGVQPGTHAACAWEAKADVASLYSQVVPNYTKLEEPLQAEAPAPAEAILVFIDQTFQDIQKSSERLPKSPERHPKVILKSSKSHPEVFKNVIQKSSKSKRGPKEHPNIIQKSSERHPKGIQRSSESHREVIKISSKAHPQVIQKSSGMHPEVI